jgi:hypothetical protein
MNLFRWLTILVALGMLGVIGVLFFKLEEKRWETLVLPEDQPFVRLAFRAEGAITAEQLRHFEEPFYPRVMRFPNEVCVQLNAKMNWTDGGSIYCFDATDRHITRSFPVRP